MNITPKELVALIGINQDQVIAAAEEAATRYKHKDLENTLQNLLEERQALGAAYAERDALLARIKVLEGLAAPAEARIQNIDARMTELLELLEQIPTDSPSEKIELAERILVVQKEVNALASSPAELPLEGWSGA